MTRTEWYGGSSEGMAGGTRLFLCGNKKDEEKALVQWSGRDNPLYFPDNAYMYVGSNDGSVTGFGKQSDMLVIFKSNETWFTQYTRNSNIDADDLIDQTVVGYTASSVYFPLTLINANIGCNYPDTVELCRNRLVWLDDDNRVYTLVSENQYNERNIFVVSEMVERLIKGGFSSASACDWEGHYVLCLDGNLLLMDYNSYGYQYISSYSKTEDAQLRIPWYYWEQPEAYAKGGIVLSLYNKLNYICINGSELQSGCYADDLINDRTVEGEVRRIECSFTTKLFDFSAPAIKKQIYRTDVQLSNNGGDEIRVEFVTDRGTDETETALCEEYTGERAAGYLENKAFFPSIRNIRTFGIRFSCKGFLAVDGISFNFKTAGGIR